MAGKKEVLLILRILEIMILLMVMTICVLLIVPKFAGLQSYSVVSGSMEPEIPVGSIIYSKTVQPSELQTNDIVVFQNAGGAVISHRVVKNKVVSGEITTKGDANEVEDPMPVNYEQVIGKEIICIPKLGGLLATATTRAGKTMMIILIVLAVIIHLNGARHH